MLEVAHALHETQLNDKPQHKVVSFALQVLSPQEERHKPSGPTGYKVEWTRKYLDEMVLFY
jgi:hypothetical protein